MNVKTYDFATKSVREIPADELAPNMTLADVDGVGHVWVDVSKTKSAPLRHTNLQANLHERAVELYRGFEVRDGNRYGNLTQLKLQEWIRNFQHDQNPDREIAIWIKIQHFFRYARHIHGTGKSLEWQHDLYMLSVLIYSNGADNALLTFDPKVMTRNSAAEIIKNFHEYGDGEPPIYGGNRRI